MRKLLIFSTVFLIFGITGLANADYPRLKIRLWGGNIQFHSGIDGLFQDIRGPETLFPEMSISDFLDGLGSQFPGLSWSREGYSMFVFHVPADMRDGLMEFLEEHKAKAFGGSGILLYSERGGEIIKTNGSRNIALDFGLEFENNILLNLGLLCGNKAEFQTVYGEETAFVASVLPRGEEGVEAIIASGNYELYRRTFTLRPWMFNFSVQKGLSWNENQSLLTYVGAGIELIWLHLSWDGSGTHESGGSDYSGIGRIYFTFSQRLRLYKGLGLEIEYRRIMLSKSAQFEVFDYGTSQRESVGNLESGRDRLIFGVYFDFH